LINPNWNNPFVVISNHNIRQLRYASFMYEEWKFNDTEDRNLPFTVFTCNS